jgi:S1-C subfamily serine protease
MTADRELSPVAELPAIATATRDSRPKRTLRGFWVRGLIAFTMVTLAILAIRPWDYWEAFTSGRRAPRREAIIISSPPPAAPVESQNPEAASNHPPEVTPKQRTRKISARLASLRDSIALVEADGPAEREVLGSAFVLNKEGQLVTCLHVANRTTSAVVRFRDGTVYDVAGYAAIDPQADLALLQLEEPPSSLVAARLAASEPEQLTAVVAWGHPQGIEFSPFDGKLSRLVKSSELPAALQRFIRDLTASDTDQTWLQHTARLSEGNSGGPLANEQGEVIGLNVWVDRQTDFSYALPVAALQNLQAQAFDDVQPLERFALAEARVRAATWQTSAIKLRQLADEARMLKWQVHDRADYTRLQHLAWGVTLANAPEHFTSKKELGNRLDDLVKEADRVAAQLHQHRWTDGGQIIVLNEFAEKELTRPGAGVVFFGTVQRVVEGKRQERALLVQLAGFDQMLLVPVVGQLSAPEAGAQCLFVGVNDRGRTVRYGDNPLQPTVASVIIAPVIVPLK